MDMSQDIYLIAPKAMEFVGCKRTKFYELCKEFGVRVNRNGYPYRYNMQDLEKVRNSEIVRYGK